MKKVANLSSAFIVAFLAAILLRGLFFFLTQGYSPQADFWGESPDGPGLRAG
jgi:hypothetical protein